MIKERWVNYIIIICFFMIDSTPAVARENQNYEILILWQYVPYTGTSRVRVTAGQLQQRHDTAQL